MQPLEFPIVLNDDVQIVDRTDDGVYIIRYKNNEGYNSVIWLPDTLKIRSALDSKGCDAIAVVKDFINKKLQKN